MHKEKSSEENGRQTGRKHTHTHIHTPSVDLPAHKTHRDAFCRETREEKQNGMHKEDTFTGIRTQALHLDKWDR